MIDERELDNLFYYWLEYLNYEESHFPPTWTFCVCNSITRFRNAVISLSNCSYCSFSIVWMCFSIFPTSWDIVPSAIDELSWLNLAPIPLMQRSVEVRNIWSRNYRICREVIQGSKKKMIMNYYWMRERLHGNDEIVDFTNESKLSSSGS